MKDDIEKAVKVLAVASTEKGIQAVEAQQYAQAVLSLTHALATLAQIPASTGGGGVP